MPELSLQLCGDIRLTVAGEPPAGPPLGAKALALLGYLAVEAGPHPREELTTLLWGEYPDLKARASLRQALTHLRDAIGEQLRIDRSTVELEATVSCDVAEFLRLARVDPSTAIEIDVPRFMTGLPIRNAPTFEEWADTRRRELVSRYVRLIAHCTRERMERREWLDAASAAERWSALEPQSDEPVAALMEARYLAGDRDAALATHERYVARLAEAAGRKPGRSIAELVERIRRDGATVPRAVTPPSVPRIGAAFTASLVGRAAEWEALRGAWEGVADGTHRIVLISGEPGVGKTRLADEFLRWVTLHSGTVLRGRGYDARTGAPFAAIIDALRMAVDAPGVAGVDPEWLAEVARVLPELRRRFAGLPETGPRTDGADSWRLFEAIAQMLTAIAEDGPVVMFVDDLHACDADSCGLLHFLVRRLASAPVLWCCAFTAAGMDRGTPPAQLSRVLRSMQGSVSVALAPLDQPALWSMIREMGRLDDSADARRLVAQVHGVAEGNPFYAVELLKTLFARELLAVDAVSGGWIIPSPALLDAAVEAFAPIVHGTIAERIEHLPDDMRELLISIAVARGTRTDVLSHVHGISRLRAAALGDALIERHLVTEEAGLYRCAHPIFANVMQQSLSASRQREVTSALAVALELTQGAGRGEQYAGTITTLAEQVARA